ncbi:MAG: chorismate mutase [SAR202 cluster bacterium]|nr:chorismate mutase [SAR202 cluster bacterium]MQG34791.1 chorismate mutase [SAR202 cluster bacterium]HAA94613.1 chorismate mutase [Dehalococcoidia bacterium]HCP23498.1 chorismate mutase [Dehalococcoidia bacterium]|tara:strand:- start:187 stop:540 length:354 start_codon:yes stop_codon:yes gene_type:complete
MTACRGIRGATTADANTEEAIHGATTELVQALIDANDIREEDIAAVFFTLTPDLNAAFAATAARKLAWANAPLMDITQVFVEGSLPSCIRILILVNTDKEAKDLEYKYLKGASSLRS